MNNNKNRKKSGFSLVEILSITIVISILFIILTPLIIGIIKKSNQKSFKNEIIGLVRDVEKTFTDNSKSVERIRVDGKSYFYSCVTLEKLVKDGFSNKNLSNGYGGYIQTWISNDNDVITFVNVTNGKYYLQGNIDVISQSDFLPSKESADGIEVASSNVKCPSDRNIPKKDVFNVQSKKVTEELEEYIKNSK